MPEIWGGGKMKPVYQDPEKNRFMTLFLRFVLVLIVAIALPIFAEEKLPNPESGKDVFGTIHIAWPKLKCSYCYQLALLLYSEAFGRLGYAVELNTFPHERSLLETNAGRMDMEAGRIRFNDTLSAKYPNLVRVDEPIRTIHLGAYTLDVSLHLSDWKDFTGQTLVIGYSRGFKLVEKRLAQYQVPAQYLREVTDVRQGARMLKRRRIDVLLALELPMADLMDGAESGQTGIQLAGMLEQIPVYPYVHQKHRALAPRLAQVLRAMKADGTYDRLVQQAKSNSKDTPPNAQGTQQK